MVLFKNVKTIEDSLKMKSHTIGQLERGLGEKKIHNYIKMWLVNLEQTTNLKRGLSEVLIDETSYYIVTEFRNLTVSDINLIFKNAKMGKYGEFYESLTMSKILGWFNDYFSERMEVAGMLSNKESHAHKSPATRNNKPQKMKEMVYLKPEDFNKLKK